MVGELTPVEKTNHGGGTNSGGENKPWWGNSLRWRKQTMVGELTPVEKPIMVRELTPVEKTNHGGGTNSGGENKPWWGN